MKKINFTQELAEDSNAITWDDIKEKLRHFTKISTGFIYTNEEQTEHIPSISYVFKGRFDITFDDSKILGGFSRTFDMHIPKNTVIYTRVYPEITINNEENKKYFYARFIAEAKS